MNIIVMGPQGSGKSTQAKLLATRLGLLSVSSGEVSRQIASENTPEGLRVREIINKGELLPDTILFTRLKKIFVSPEAAGGLVLDGYPRNLSQLLPLEEFLKGKKWSIDKVFVINLSEEEGKKRLALRAKIEGRQDDTPETISRRLAIYHEQTEPILDYYRKAGKVIDIDGAPGVAQIHEAIMAYLPPAQNG